MTAHFRRSKRKSVKPDIQLAKDTLSIAQRELESAKAMYDKGFYPEAIFWLQQSIEKGWKSFGFYYGVIDEEDARSYEISHKGSRVANKTLKVLQRVVLRLRSNIKKLQYLFDITVEESPRKKDHLEQLQDSILEATSELNDYITNEDKYRNLSCEELTDLINNLNSLIEILEIVEEIIKKPILSEELYARVKQNVYEMGLSIFRGFPQIESILRKIIFEDLTNQLMEKLLKNLLHGMIVVDPLLYLAIITQAHEQSTRYIIAGKSPTQIYTPSHPLVQKFPEIGAIATSTLENLKEFYQMIPPEDIFREMKEKSTN